jgi:hypothetical protein
VILEHHEAIRTLLASLEFYDGQVPSEPTFPYRVLYLDTGFERSEKLCATSNRADFRFQITSVALTAQGVAIVADQSRSLLVDARPVVTGRVCAPIRRETSIPVRPDADVTDPGTNLHPMFSVDTYHFVSFAA